MQITILHIAQTLNAVKGQFAQDIKTDGILKMMKIIGLLNLMKPIV
jgi:hypothetical protein